MHFMQQHQGELVTEEYKDLISRMYIIIRIFQLSCTS